MISWIILISQSIVFPGLWDFVYVLIQIVHVQVFLHAYGVWVLRFVLRNEDIIIASE